MGKFVDAKRSSRITMLWIVTVVLKELGMRGEAKINYKGEKELSAGENRGER